MLETGMKSTCTVQVTTENTAAAMGSGKLQVFGTPALAALIEKTCWQAVQPELEEGCGTVGIRLELNHTAATPVGMVVRCEAELTAVEGRKLTFSAKCFDEVGQVGDCIHERFIIWNDKFQAKADAKGKQ